MVQASHLQASDQELLSLATFPTELINAIIDNLSNEEHTIKNLNTFGASSKKIYAIVAVSSIWIDNIFKIENNLEDILDDLEKKKFLLDNLYENLILNKVKSFKYIYVLLKKLNNGDIDVIKEEVISFEEMKDFPKISHIKQRFKSALVDIKYLTLYNTSRCFIFPAMAIVIPSLAANIVMLPLFALSALFPPSYLMTAPATISSLGFYFLGSAIGMPGIVIDDYNKESYKKYYEKEMLKIIAYQVEK
jgi:hypothetical protein